MSTETDKPENTSPETNKSTVTSPNQVVNLDLKKQIKITTPGVWIVLSAICIALIGFLVWASLYNIETTKKALMVRTENEQTYCCTKLDFDELTQVCKYGTVYVDGTAYKLNTDYDKIEYAYYHYDENLEDILTLGAVEHEIDIDEGDKYYYIPVENIDLQSPSALGYVVTERESPISYLIHYDWGH